jgi:hypothetical protein
MANQQKLKDNSTTVEFNPLGGYRAGRIQETSRHRSRSGKLYTYQFFTDKWRYEIPVIIEVAADANQINTWAKNNTELTFYYDLINEAAQTKTVHIINDGDPLQMMEYTWKNRYEGTIILEEV